MKTTIITRTNAPTPTLHTHTHSERERERERERDLPTPFMTKTVVYGLQLCYYLSKSWSFSWLLTPALLNQPVGRNHQLYFYDLTPIILLPMLCYHYPLLPTHFSLTLQN